MENAQTALSLCFLAHQNIVFLTNNRVSFISNLQVLLRDQYGIEDVVEIDLLHCHGDFYKEVTDQMVKCEEGSQPRLHEVVLWKNLETVEMNFDRKNSLVRIFNELEQHNTLRSRDCLNDEPFQFGNYTVRKPELFLVILVMKSGKHLPKIHPQIKDRFWFCQYCQLHDEHRHSQHHKEGTSDAGKELLAGRKQVLKGRQALPTVFANAQIQEYVCSLLVFTRSHRLCSLAPSTTRLTFRALEGIMKLAKSLVVLSAEDGKLLFVTPEYIKVAFRKIGYWFVDWETNALFGDLSVESEHRKRLELTILTGDWYGSEWDIAKEYMGKFASTEDRSTTSGFTNMIVEDVLQSVRPPL